MGQVRAVRQRRGRMRPLAGVAVTLALMASTCSRPWSFAPSGMGSDAFVGADVTSVDVRSAVTGEVERAVAPATQGRLQVRGVAVRGQQVFVTYAAGPSCTNGAVGCAPLPGSCGAEVDRFDLRTGIDTVVWTVGRDTFLAHVVPSPDGTKLAALASPCVPSYFNQHLLVHSLRSAPDVTIGAALPRCHDLRSPSWSSDGTRILVVYAPAVVDKASGPYDGPDGVCPASGAERLLSVDARASRPTLTGPSRGAGQGCRFGAAAADRAGAYAIMICGAKDRAVLQRFDADLAPGRRWPVDDGVEEGALAVDAAGEVVMAVYRSREPQTTVYVTSAGQLRRVAVTGHLGVLIPDDVSW